MAVVGRRLDMVVLIEEGGLLHIERIVMAVSIGWTIGVASMDSGRCAGHHTSVDYWKEART